MKKPTPFDAIFEHEKLTRFEVIDHRKKASEPGRRLVLWEVDPMEVAVSVQDNGQTVKVFIYDRPEDGQS